MQERENIRIGDLVLNRACGHLEDAAGAARPLRPKSYRVLEVLSERRGELISKDDLVAEAWPDVIASDDSLAHCISDIRRALGPDAAKLLRTVPRRGYILAASQPAAPAQVPPGSRSGIILSGVVAGLMLIVAGAWWGMPHPAVGEASDSPDAALQRADVLLEARDWRRREDNEQARKLLEQVVAGDPDNADAMASLGLTYWLEVQHLAWGGGRREMNRALELVERSVALGGSDRSHRLLAEMRLLAPFSDLRSPVDALASARAAVDIAPANADNLAVLAQALALTGHAKDAVATIEQALGLSAAPPDWHRQVAGLSYLLAGESARAAEELGPLYGAGTFANARWWPGWLFAASLAHAGRIDQAELVVKAARNRRPEHSVAAVAHSFDGFADEAGLSLFLDGLRLAGLPG